MDKDAEMPMDLADATVVALAEETGQRKIVSLDSDHHVYWIR
jgi:predicted nucleic acid-binding protein